MTTRRLIVAASAIAFAGAAGNASAYTPKWLQCDGQLVVQGGEDAGTKPAHDYYIYDDDNKNLFTYLQEKGTEAIEPVRVYDDKEIRWSMEGGGINHARWEGHLDRKSLALRLDYAETGSTRTWTEQCKPTSPVTGKASADAGNAKPSAARATGKSGE